RLGLVEIRIVRRVQARIGIGRWAREAARVGDDPRRGGRGQRASNDGESDACHGVLLNLGRTPCGQENGKLRTENGELKTGQWTGSALSVLDSRLSILFLLASREAQHVPPLREGVGRSERQGVAEPRRGGDDGLAGARQAQPPSTGAEGDTSSRIL